MGPAVSDLQEDTGYEEPQQWHQGLDLGTTSDPQKIGIPSNGDNLTEVDSGRETRSEEDPFALVGITLDYSFLCFNILFFNSVASVENFAN